VTRLLDHAVWSVINKKGPEQTDIYTIKGQLRLTAAPYVRQGSVVT